MTKIEENIIISRSSANDGTIPITAEDEQALAELRQARAAPNTERAYRNDWAAFSAWCAARGGNPAAATPANVAAYLAGLRKEGFMYVSIARAAAGICNELAEHDRRTWLSRPFEVQAVLRDLARALGKAPRFGKKPLTIDLLESGVAAAYPGWSIRETRNRALVVFGYYIATRRKEMVSLRFGNLDTSQLARGLGITIPKSKTDQEGVGIPKFVFRQPEMQFCPVRVVTDWGHVSGLIHAGSAPAARYVFPELSSYGTVLDRPAHPTAVSRAVKEVAEALGLDPDEYGSHSLRSGFVSDAAAQGVPLERIANQTGHRNLDQLRRYIKRLHPWQNNATEGFAKRARETSR